jgi:hypothetical protein
MRTSETEEISTTERPNFCSIFIFCFFSSSSSFFSFFYVFSLFFLEAQSRNTNKFQHNGIYLYKMKNTRFKLAKFPDYGGSGLWIFLYGAALWY